MDRSPPQMNFDEHILLLGQAARASHQYEITTSVILAKVLDIDLDRAHVIASGAGQGSVLGMIKALASRSDSRLRGDAVLDWLKVARQAQEARNRITHSLWTYDDQQQMTAVMGRGLTVEPRSKADLEEDLRTLMRAVDEASDLVRRP